MKLITVQEVLLLSHVGIVLINVTFDTHTHTHISTSNIILNYSTLCYESQVELVNNQFTRIFRIVKGLRGMKKLSSRADNIFDKVGFKFLS
jgi:hypothetical protein